MEYLFSMGFIVFFICNLINVILSTIKSIVTAKGTKTAATLMNAISYGFYTIIVKQLADVSIPVAVSVTIITNLIGVYASCWFMEKIKKECLWVINATTKDSSILKELEKYNIQYSYNNTYYKDKEFFHIQIFSKNHNDSKVIKSLLNNSKVKYHIEEISKNF